METNAGILVFSAEDGPQTSESAEASGVVLLLVSKQHRTII